MSHDLSKPSVQYRLVGFLRDCKFQGSLAGVECKKGSVKRLPVALLEQIQAQAPGAVLDLTPKPLVVGIKSLFDSRPLRRR
jgi:hypothetical protein